MSDAVERDTECARLRGSDSLRASATRQGEINSDFDGAGTGTSKNRSTDLIVSVVMARWYLIKLQSRFKIIVCTR